MKFIPYKGTINKGVKVILLFAILLMQFGVAVTGVAYAAPSNDNFANATLITGISFTDSINTTTATREANDEDGFGPCDPEWFVTDLQNGGKHNVWYTYTPSVNEWIAIDTKGSDYDTYVAIWTGTHGSLNLVDCNDDGLVGTTSELSYLATAGTTYYYEVSEYNGYIPPDMDTDDPAGNLVFNVNITNVDVTIGTDLMGKYYIGSGESAIKQYPVDGAVVIKNTTTTTNIVASLFQLRRVSPTATEYTGITQTMGLPIEKLSNIYVMPRYDYSDPSRQYDAVLVANMDSVDRQITITIGGTPRETFTLPPSGSAYKTYLGVAGGPLVVSSDTGAKIIASLYELKKDPKVTTGSNGQSEMMGVPWGELSNTYLIPIYFGHPSHTSLKPSLFIANADTVPRAITVKIGGVEMAGSPYTLQPGTDKVLTYPLDGAVEISSASGAKIVASLFQLRRVSPTAPEYTGITQTMGLQIGKLSNIYVMPRYDYSDSSRQYDAVLVANMDTVDRQITITIGGTPMETFTLPPSGSAYKTYPGVAGGPLVVSSDTGAKIIASLYELRKDPKTITGSNGQSEMMGVPWGELSDTYLIPIYFGDPSHTSLYPSLFIGAP